MVKIPRIMERKIVKKVNPPYKCMDLYLCYFDKVTGPLISISIPQPSNPQYAEEIMNIMDSAKKENFFEHRSNELLYTNYYFEIQSQWARGKMEMLMLSAIFQGEVNIPAIQVEIQNMVVLLKHEPLLYKAFYMKQKHTDPGIQEQFDHLQTIMQTFAIALEERAHQSRIGDILVIGTENSGKTAIVERLTNGVFVEHPKPTLSLQILKTVLSNIKLRIYDVGGQPQNRQLWFKALKSPKAIVFVLDYTAERSRLTDIRTEFAKVIAFFYNNQNPERTSAQIPQNLPPFLILANKIDLVEEPSEITVAEMLQFHGDAFINTNHRIQLVSAKNNKGIHEGFGWLIQQFLSDGF